METLKLLIAIGLLAFMASCDQPKPIQRPIPEKPFYIIDKYCYSEKRQPNIICSYRFLDANQNEFVISGTINEHSVGDTVK